MSGLDSQQTKCSCPRSQCLQGNCKCFKARLWCSESCKCKECRNNENNKAEVDTRYEGYFKQKNPTVAEHPTVPLPPAKGGCECKVSKCANMRCYCFGHRIKCTSKCSCQNCTNGSDSNNEQGMGGAGGVPDEAVHATPPSNIESEKTGDTGSMAGEAPQMEEQPNKRPRIQ